MSDSLILIGPLAEDRLRAALGVQGQPCGVAGRLHGGACAGVADGAWPVWQPGAGHLPGVRARPCAALDLYAAVMQLEPLDLPEGRVLGARRAAADRPLPDAPWDATTWQGDAAAAQAGLIVQDGALHPAATLRARLPMLAVWAESRRRAAAMTAQGGALVPDRGPDAVRIERRRQPFAGFFAVEEWVLRHRTHAGGISTPVRREGFVMGDAVVVLPWDPVRDRVLLIEQFRAGPAMRHDPRPWLLEAIAGRIDAGETVEEAARREAREEADLKLMRLFPAIHHYPSPGAVTEFLYLFIGIADLGDGAAGVHGLQSEAEDIRGHLLARADLMAMLRAGQISNGPLAMLALFLQAEAADLSRRAGEPGGG